MSLAVVIFDKDSRLCEELALEPYEHFKLMRKLDGRDFPMLCRLSSYFDDTMYEPHELPQLIREVRQLLKEASPDDPIAPLLKSLRSMAKSAYERDTNMNVIGDYAYP